jgi:hypothetical protein
VQESMFPTPRGAMRVVGFMVFEDFLVRAPDLLVTFFGLLGPVKNFKAALGHDVPIQANNIRNNN